jgi:ABC-2 type transport system permease protein
MKEEGFDKEVRHEKVNDLFMIYLAALVSRSDVVKVTALGLSDGLSTPEYYFSALLLFFMLLLSFCSISFFLGTKDAQYKFMAAKGIDAPKQVLGEYIPFLTINVILVLFIAAGSKRYQLAGQLLPVAIMFAALGFLIFEVLIGVINKILVAFMLYMGMGYVSGYFYPKTFFPDLVQQIGEKIPTGVAFTYMAAVLQGNSTGRYLVLMLGSTLVFLGLAMFAREQKIK